MKLKELREILNSCGLRDDAEVMTAFTKCSNYASETQASLTKPMELKDGRWVLVIDTYRHANSHELKD